jgi:hypothetical protein
VVPAKRQPQALLDPVLQEERNSMKTNYFPKEGASLHRIKTIVNSARPECIKKMQIIARNAATKKEFVRFAESSC